MVLLMKIMQKGNYILRNVWRYQSSNQEQLIKEGQTIQWPKKDKRTNNILQNTADKTKWSGFFLSEQLRFYCYRWFDTSAGELLVPDGIIRPVVSTSTLPCLLRYN